MKNLFLSVFFACSAAVAFAQDVTLNGETIMSNGTPYAKLKKSNGHPLRYDIYSLSGERLITVHHNKNMIDGNPAYVMTFLNDHEQAIIVNRTSFPNGLIKKIVKYNLIDNGSTVNKTSEAEFVDKFPIPEGYLEVEDQDRWM